MDITDSYNLRPRYLGEPGMSSTSTIVSGTWSTGSCCRWKGLREGEPSRCIYKASTYEDIEGLEVSIFGLE